MPITLDFDGVSDSGFEALPAGLYPAKIAEVNQKMGRESQKPYLEFKFVLNDPAGRFLWRNYSLQTSALWALKADLGKLGIEIPEGPFELDEQDLIGMEVQLEVAQKPHWQDSSRLDNEITEISAADAGGW
jgi:hypothetical protein